MPDEPLRSISREDMAKLPIRRYAGKLCVVATPHDLAHALADLRQERVVGLDTETRPAFRKGEVHLPCLAQAATAHAVYLFPLRHRDAHPVLAELLAEPRIVPALPEPGTAALEACAGRKRRRTGGMNAAAAA
ncbi:MAG: hypothetical protein WBM28_15560 [Burkholderiales bacterium]